MYPRQNLLGEIRNQKKVHSLFQQEGLVYWGLTPQQQPGSTRRRIQIYWAKWCGQMCVNET